ncbi:aerobic glycerol-3-phosphate dehydrogenase [Collibacillus ludicampi]|uniref:Glycerol-3-phosphate dehydrogenase n=1 Tax=Collibacillus ludicampi TaxID=2771369 RepID=A0AAV4LCP2_9BACL|nr:glycerol-3-phosphate dehydrogenase/oxidase [Collibacillus ludicampi]GIM45607.1 aerobic glycerol-3-phosphate dehydrogenase [Collibacillus ludicampi]
MKRERQLSTKNRRQYLEDMANEPLDVIIIGGGITGAGIALDAASRGLHVGLVEKQDFGAGTSSRSTKLIHGGLRYLKQGEVNLVKEVGRERDTLYRNAPHIVIPEKMLLPLVANGTYGRLATSIGLWIYDRLAGVAQEERRVMLSKRHTEELEPLLRKDILKGSGLYIEYRTDDARLTIEVIKTAASYGALCVNYTEATRFLYKDQKVIGVQVRDVLTGEKYEIFAKKVVNAAGPWVDQVREKDKSLYGKRLHLTKGVHLVVPRHRLPLRQSVYFDVPDGRMIFAIPRDRATYIGTTDTDYHGNLETPRVTKDDVAYLLEAVNHMFPSVRLKEEDITSSWAGLRPLIHEDGKLPSELSRKDEIFHSPSGLITIAGGKLTGFRKMAERVVDLVVQELKTEEGREFHECTTDKIVLAGGDFSHPEQIPAFVRIIHAKAGAQMGISEEQVLVLVGRFGTNAAKIMEKALELRAAHPEKDPSLLLMCAELSYCIEEEMAVNLNDFLIRRTGRLFFERETLEPVYRILLEEMAKLLEWNEEQKLSFLEQFEEEYRNAVQFV